MKFYLHSKKHLTSRSSNGFALVATILLMVLLAIITVGTLSLSVVTLRTNNQDSAQALARANAQMALMIAIGELQKEMGPDMRVSAESALFDSDKNTEMIDGVEQSHWMASYNSWGNWLNADYQLPDGGANLKISDTYNSRRDKMFRRWLLSLPPGLENDITAPNSLASWNNTNSVELVGKNSLGTTASTDQITRAYLTSVGETGKFAWWISPENHKARIDKAKIPRTLNVDEWQTAQGDTAEVGVGGLSGYETLDQNTTISNKLFSTQTLRVAEIEKEKVQQHFFDLTAQSQGVLTSVRSGHLKKDLSLLLEKDNANLPTPYKFNIASDVREPSIRPMSSEISTKPIINGRHFQSWTNMRHYYRMYRQNSDATVKPYAASNVNNPNTINNPGGGIGGSGSLNWATDGPYTDIVSTANTCDRDMYNRWPGFNNYWRVPVLAKITFIFSLRTTIRTVGPPTRYDYDLLYTPVFTFWNPYNVRLRIPDQQIVLNTSAYPTIPIGRVLYNNNTFINEGGINPSAGINYGRSYLRSSNGNEIIFEPGEFRVFSYSSAINNSVPPLNLYPGFDPQAINGDYIRVLNNQPSTYNAGIAMRVWNSEWGGNINAGNTAGSLNILMNWAASDPRNQAPSLPLSYQNDWFNVSQQREYITPNPGTPVTNPGAIARWNYADRNPIPIAYVQLALKGQSQSDYESISWQKDWRSRNWISGPPFYFGHSLYASEDPKTLHTQRLEHPYVMNFGPTSMAEFPKIVFQQGSKAFLGSGSNPFEKVSQVPAIELPTAPLSSIAGFSGMRINPGWANIRNTFPLLRLQTCNDIPNKSLYGSENKVVAYQSGVTGPGIGNSFMHPLLPRNDVYRFFNNSISMDPATRNDWANPTPVDNQVFSDHWDHVFLLNDALWDDYFVSSLADQTRPGASAALSLSANLDKLVAGGTLSNSRYQYYSGGKSAADTKAELQATDGYLKAAKHLVVDGMFNVNSTSVSAWYALFAGIRERQLVYRDTSGQLKKIDVPAGKRIAISRFDTEVSDKEMDDPESGVTMPDGSPGWSGVRFLDDEQLQKLAEECVKQVKKRGPFLNFAEFINRRLSDDELGTMGALQSAIDYDDGSPDSKSLNYRFKNGPDFMLIASDLGAHDFQTPEAAVGSRFAGIPGYVIQSDLLKPIANTLAVRDDTFLIRAYGESLNKNGKVIARAWCEAVVQRTPEYTDPANDASEPARLLDLTGGTVNPINNKYGTFSDNPTLTEMNRRFGRKFLIQSFRWLNPSEI